MPSYLITQLLCEPTNVPDDRAAPDQPATVPDTTAASVNPIVRRTNQGCVLLNTETCQPVFIRDECTVAVAVESSTTCKVLLIAGHALYVRGTLEDVVQSLGFEPC